MDASDLDSFHPPFGEHAMRSIRKVIVSTLFFAASIVGVVTFTHWLPGSPLASIESGSPDNRDDRQRGDGRDGAGHLGPQNRDAAELSASSFAESLTTLVPQAMIIGGFAFGAERSRRQRNSRRRTSLNIHD